MCSKCFRDLGGAAATPAAPAVVARAEPVARSEPMAVPAAMAVDAMPSPSPVSSSLASSPMSTCASVATSPSPAKKKHVCFQCKKSVGLLGEEFHDISDVLGFACRCEQEFCAKHRDAKEHSCTFDYKVFDRSRIEKSNPAIKAAKVPGI